MFLNLNQSVVHILKLESVALLQTCHSRKDGNPFGIDSRLRGNGRKLKFRELRMGFFGKLFSQNPSHNFIRCRFW